MFKELIKYLWKNKSWWIIPPVIILIIFGALVVFSQTSPLSPFIYVLF